MLSNLSIENIAVIEKAEIDFNFGLNVFTGETGAGKSIIIDAIHAVLGERTSRGLIRTGADSAFVSALFNDVSPAVTEKLFEFGIECKDNTLLIQRKMTSDGKNTCRINGNLTTLAIIREISPFLINIHGQHDEHELLDSASHCRFIDGFGKLDEYINDYLDSFNKLKSLRKKIKTLQADEGNKEKRIEILKYQINEIDSANIRIGEKEELSAKVKSYSNSEKLIKLLRNADESISGDNGIINLLQSVLGSLKASEQLLPQLDSVISEMNDAYYKIQNSESEIKENLSNLDFSPQEFDAMSDRLDFLTRLCEKYGGSDEEVIAYYNNALEELNTIETSEETLNRLNIEYEELRSKTETLAHTLSEQRNRAGKALCERIKEELNYLDMPSVSFIVSNNTGNFTANGIDNIEFLVSANVGEEPRPLSKIASGGELSRIMLAIKNVLAEHDIVETLIFDEIDTGISGRAAQKVGLKLHQLAKQRQVICVTHLSQLAVEADTHLLIEKNVIDGRTYTTVKTLDFEGRKYEIARILGGATITEITLKNAEELLLKAKN